MHGYCCLPACNARLADRICCNTRAQSRKATACACWPVLCLLFVLKLLKLRLQASLWVCCQCPHRRLVHTADLLTTPLQGRLVPKLARLTGACTCCSFDHTTGCLWLC